MTAAPLLPSALGDRAKYGYMGEEMNVLLNSHLEGEISEKDGIIKRKSNLSFEAFIDLGEGGRQYQATERVWPMEPSEVHVWMGEKPWSK